MNCTAEGFNLKWTNLQYIVGVENGKRILNGISGQALPNRFLAVLGGSGAGKTTFLNAISSRLLQDKAHTLEGEILLNDASIEKGAHRFAFVTQQDIVFNTATPEEALYFSARVRAALGKTEAMKRAREILEELMLLDVKDSVIGVPGMTRGISGGERKRTNIGVELVTNPHVLILDEPTSGLDSFTAEKVIQLVHSLAEKGRTVICSIHQPSANVLNLFDDLMLLVDGKVVYLGEQRKCIEYFQSIGFDCPQDYTPTDYFMSLMQDETVKHQLIDSWQRIARTEEAEKFQFQATSNTSDQRESTEKGDACVLSLQTLEKRRKSSFLVQFSELYLRSFRNFLRDRHILMAQLGQSVVFAVVVGLVYINLGFDQTSVQDRMGLFFIMSTNAAFAGASSVINTFAAEKSVFVREQHSRAYSPLCYFIGKTFGEAPFQLLFTCLSVTIIYLFSGLTRKLSAYLSFLGAVTLGYQSGISLGLLLGAACPNFLVSSALMPLILVPMLLAGGLAVSAGRLSNYWIWLKKISIVRYTFTVLAKFEFSNIARITCDEAKFPGRCALMYQSGIDVLKRFKMNGKDSETYVLLLSLAGILVFLRVLAVVALYRAMRLK